MKITIVVIGYNRIDSINRLLMSLSKAYYLDDRVDLIISLDRCDKTESFIKELEKYNWKYGSKKIRSFEKRLGLRNHVIECGKLVEGYDAIIVLEDDLLVSPYFYSYVKQTLKKYGEDDHIAGISLYKNELNNGVNLPFVPSNNGYDVFMMQLSQSWGQCWTKKMWNEFYEWYQENCERDLKKIKNLPSYISSWDERSWLKYHMAYTVENNKYHIYPYIFH